MPSHIQDQLASSLGKSDEGPNIALAEKIVKKTDVIGMKDLIGLLMHKSGTVRNDVIKVIYEIAERNVDLVLPYTDTVLLLLDHQDNRMKWGAMSALSAISKTKPDLMAQHLLNILKAMDTGSVITRDHGIYILCNISGLPSYHDDCLELLLEQLEKAPVNQTPMYAEQIANIISEPYKKRFIKIISSRKDVLEIPSKQKRLEKLLKKLQA